MTFNPLVLTGCRQFLGPVDLTGYSNKIDISASFEDLDPTTFASGAKERRAGLADTQISVEGFFAATDLTAPDDAIWAAMGLVTQPYTAAPAATAAPGDLAYLTKVATLGYSPGADVGKLLAYTLNMSGNQLVARGAIMHPPGTARTATGTGVAVQLGAVAATQSAYCNLHVLSVSATVSPSLTVKLQSASDQAFTTPHDRVTFTAATALGGQASSAAGAVTDTWWRVVWTISGTSASFLFTASAGIAHT